jgi:hypothetical protein
MSACAGSLTDAKFDCCVVTKVWLLLRPETDDPEVFWRLFPVAREVVSGISPAWSRWIAHGRIGLMSTQRRVDHLRLAHCMDRAASSGDRLRCSPAREIFAVAAGQTAPPESPARTATNSLSSDHHNQQPVRLVLFDIRIGSPPLGKASAKSPSLEHLPGYPTLHSSADRVRSIRPCRVYRQP